jgi:predicted nucleotidyltransferase
MEAATIRSEVLAKAVGSLSAMQGVDAIYLSGSLAEKIEDQYSDIDLRVVVADVDYESVRTLREILPKTWGPFLFHQTVAENLTVTYYDSLTKADVFYYPASSVAPSPWFNLGTKILFERSGALRAVIKASETLEFTGTSSEIVSQIQKCIAGFAESAKRARRGEAIYASRLSAEAIHHLFIADDLMSRRPPLGGSKRESRVPGRLTTLARTHLAVPADVGASQYISDWSSAILNVVHEAVSGGFCSEQVAGRLTAALEQLVALSTGK